ncbi:hypothetical protein BM127P2_00041 [Phocaeicola phage BM127P2]|nr:hypothetical protein BM127P1_00026 [Phocaeicola phage BM127P1]WAX08320.1 hypothetical protein BM127P2_00041 [Phocaeicola phage BM127P2]WAX08327.1 hypothetical protein BM127P3_00001 [Phocaeicola phage BM127P3]WAX08414.1 hypothetical protein BM127P4_00041 [Phocaeicola phage BM127P4]
MKKLVVLLVLVMTSVSMFSQITSNGKPEVLKSFRLGVCKLIDTGGDISIEATVIEATSLKLTVDLGKKEQAIAILQSMVDYKPAKGETVSLNNPSDNEAEYQKFNGVWLILSRGKAASIAVSKGEMKKMITALNKR